MGPILTAIATSLVSKVIGGGQQQQPTFDPWVNKRPRLPMQGVEPPFALRGMLDPRHIPLMQENPILAAYVGNAPAEEPKPKSGKSGDLNFKDQFLQSLTQGIVAKMLGGGQQSSYQYAPPSFR